jgi:molybdenum cofactor synthesis domain-containing protein
MYKVGIITASDSGSEGKREDLSGQLIREIVEKAGYLVVDYKMVPDDLEMIKETIIYMSDGIGVDLVLTTGGTGFSKRDNTPEATLAAVQRRVPGIPEAMRYLSLQITPKAMLSRAEAGIRNDTLIINLPGSPKAVRECLEYIMGPMEHGLEILKGDATNCAEEDKSSKK